MTIKSIYFSATAGMFLSVLLLGGCTKNDELTDQGMNAETIVLERTPDHVEFYALSSGNELVQYVSGNPVEELGSSSITGLQSGENLLAIDFRPATGQLYGVSDQSRLYVIDPATGTAVAVSMTPFSPAINGSAVGFDFNPTVDRIRLVTDLGQNLRLHPVTGAVAAVDGSINPGGKSVVAVGYTNSFAGSTSTTLYDIDVATDKLYRQMPPNNGTLVEVGSLGLQADGEGGFDIAPDNSIALAVLFARGADDDGEEVTPGNKYRFYTINLQTGKAKNAGKTDREIIGLAIPGN
jgi:hypothetical protein